MFKTIKEFLTPDIQITEIKTDAQLLRYYRQLKKHNFEKEIIEACMKKALLNFRQNLQKQENEAIKMRQSAVHRHYHQCNKQQ